MKKSLKEYFGNKIIITDINGKPNVIAFYSTASAILKQFYQWQRNEDTEKEKLKLVEAAVKIIKNDIKSPSTSNETYWCKLFAPGWCSHTYGKKHFNQTGILDQALMQAVLHRF